MIIILYKTVPTLIDRVREYDVDTVTRPSRTWTQQELVY